MKQMVKYYLKCYFLYFKMLNEYKFNWFISIVKIPLILVLYWFLWKTIFHYHTGPLDKYNFNDMMIYLFAVQWIATSLSLNISEKIAEEIRNGDLSIQLARPIDYLPTKFATFAAHFCFGLVITIIPFSYLFYVLMGNHSFPIKYFEFISSMFIAGIIYFLLECLFGMCAFWLNKVFGLHFLIMTFFNIAGGKLIPLTLFPSWFQKISYLSPLRAIYYEPINILFKSSITDTLKIQLPWMFFLLAAVALLWHRGKIVYEASG